MPRIKFEKIKTIVTSEYWLILTLSGAFFIFFALNRGGIVLLIDLSGFFLFLNFLTGDYRLKRIPSGHLITGAICIYLLLASIFVSSQHSHHRWMANLVRMLIVVFAIHCLSQKRINYRVIALFHTILSLSVCWQFIAYYLFKMPYGTFTNPHYLASFAVLVLPMIIYAFFDTKGWYKFIFIPIAMMDADLLLRTGSRTAFIGIFLGTLFVFIFLTRGYRRWYGMTMILIILAIGYITEYANMAPKIEELIIDLQKEERVQLYSHAWNKFTENSLGGWMFGHGIGRFPVIYTPDSSLKPTYFVFPHSYFFEIVYLNGLIGAVLIFGGLALLFASIVRAAIQNQNRKTRLLLKCLIIVFLNWLIHCSLTFPFYSKYSLFPLAFILGTILALVGKTDNDVPVVHEHR